MLVFFRIIQGATGGALQPISQAVLLEAFPPHERGKAMGFWGLGIVVAPILGPVLGGWLTDSYSWRWVFYINIPVGIVSLIMTKLYIFDPPYIRRSDKGIDYWGIGMLAVGIGALQIVLDKGQEVDWFSSHWIAGLMVTAIVLLAIFIVWELMVGNPVVDLRVFKQRTYATGVFLMTTLGFVLYGSLVLLPIMLQTLFGYPALQAGIAMAPRGIGSFIFMPIVGMMLGRFDARKILVIGVALSAWTLIWLGDINLNAGYWDIFWPQFVQGVGMAFVFVPLTTITMDPIPKERMGNATSLFNVMRNIGGSVGIATATTLLARRQQVHINVMGAHVNPYSGTSRALYHQIQGGFVAAGADPTTAAHQTTLALFGIVRQQAAMMSFVEVFWWFGALFFAALPLVFLMRRPSGKPGSVAAH